MLKYIARLAYTIFDNDVDYAIHFMHPTLLSLGMIKLPLPCSPALWEAQTADEWAREMEETGQRSRSSYLRSLQASIEVLLREQCDHSKQRQRGSLQVFSSSAFTLQVLIHGLASAVLEFRFRSVDTRCTSDLHILKLRDLENGLACWYRCFQHMNHNPNSLELARSALNTYHFASILLRESLSDIQMAAGTAYSWGRAVTPRRAQEAFIGLVTTQPVGQESYHHALKILALCLQDKTETAELSYETQQTRMLLQPLHLTYNSFIAVLVLWAYALGLSRTQKSKLLLRHAQDPLWVVEAGVLKLKDDIQRRNDEGTMVESCDTDDFGDILNRGLARPEIETQKIETIRMDICRLMRTVRKHLAESAWEICK